MAPALASWNGHLYLAWTGTDYRLNLMRSADGRRFDDKQRLEQRSYLEAKSQLHLPPALAATPEGLYLAWTGGDRRLNVMDVSGGPDGGEASHLVLPERTNCSPWLSTHVGLVWLSWLGYDGHLYVACGQDGRFTAPARLPVRSGFWSGYAKFWFGHGTCTVGDQVVVAWKPPGRRSRSPFRFACLHGVEITDPVEVEARTRSGPAIASAGDVAVVTWTGRHRRIMAMAFSPAHGPGPIVRLPARTRDRAVVAAHDGNLVLAWTSTHKRLCVAPLHPR